MFTLLTTQKKKTLTTLIAGTILNVAKKKKFKTIATANAKKKVAKENAVVSDVGGAKQKRQFKTTFYILTIF